MTGGILLCMKYNVNALRNEENYMSRYTLPFLNCLCEIILLCKEKKKKVTSTICLEVIVSISLCQGTQKKKRREHCKAYLFTIFLLDYLLGLHRSWVLHSSAQRLHSRHRARKYEITFTISFFPLHTTVHEYRTRPFTYTVGEHFKLVNRWFRKWGQHTNGKWTDPPFSKWQTDPRLICMLVGLIPNLRLWSKQHSLQLQGKLSQEIDQREKFTAGLRSALHLMMHRWRAILNVKLTTPDTCRSASSIAFRQLCW